MSKATFDKARQVAAFPSPRGDKLCPGPYAVAVVDTGFRPLAGISCVECKDLQLGSKKEGFRPLAGISCVSKTAQLEPMGFGLGSDTITISHSAATGKWQLEIKISPIFLREPLQTAIQVATMAMGFAQSANSLWGRYQEGAEGFPFGWNTIGGAPKKVDLWPHCFCSSVFTKTRAYDKIQKKYAFPNHTSKK